MNIDIFASETGYYTVDECGDTVQPVLTMQQGVTYRFVQNDETNWSACVELRTK